MSPFVTSHVRPCPACTHGPNAGGEHRPDSVLYRRAVGSLEEARTRASEITLPFALAIQPAEDRALVAAFEALTESGGTIGPLPDGSRVTVEPISYLRLCEESGESHIALIDHRTDYAFVLAAWNRELGVGHG